MEFNKSHSTIIDNLQLALRKCELPGAKGEEMLALAQGYHFLSHMKQYIEIQIIEQQKKLASQQALSTATPTDSGIQTPTQAEKSKKK